MIYLDTDAMFVSNPVHVWNQRDLANAHRVLFQWDAFTCSGVLLMHTGAFERAGLWSVFQVRMRARARAPRQRLDRVFCNGHRCD